MRSVKISAKLLSGFAILMGLLLLLSLVWVVQTRRLTNQVKSAVNVTARRQQLAGLVRRTAADILAAENSIVLGSILQRPVTVTQGKADLQAGLSGIEQALKTLRSLSDSPAMLSTIAAVETEVTSAAGSHAEMMQYVDKQQFDQVQRTFDERTQPKLKEIAQKAELLAKEEEADLLAAADAADTQSRSTYWMIGVFLLVGLGAGTAVLLIILQTNNQLRNVAREIAHGAGKVASAAGQVSSASQSLAHGASEQAAALEETASAMEQMNSVTRKNSDNSRSTASLMRECEKVVGSAEGTVRELSGSMQEISASGEKITKVVKMIDDIAFQTKILSLNAAVEAARAGAAGAGFAVVADQVGHLAQECAEAARSTSEMIDATVSRVRDGGIKLSRTAEVIQQVVQQVSNVRILVDEVHVGSEEQSKGIGEVAKSIGHMQQMTQRAAATAQETASAGQEMDSYADSLNRIVSRMNVMVGVNADDSEWTRARSRPTNLQAPPRHDLQPGGRSPKKFPAANPASDWSISSSRAPTEEEFQEF